MKIFTTTILFTFIIFYNSNAIAETKRDCSMYSSKTHVGMLEKRRCKKGLHESNAIAETKRDCSMYSNKTHVGMVELWRCKAGLPQKEKTTFGQKLKKLNPFKKKK